uniref:Uncharacterized protein n=1 Tax=Rhizophora mucronata TaxID=61149 RepID=A0A2P2P051_RHIMU
MHRLLVLISSKIIADPFTLFVTKSWPCVL